VFIGSDRTGWTEDRKLASSWTEDRTDLESVLDRTGPVRTRTGPDRLQTGLQTTSQHYTRNPESRNLHLLIELINLLCYAAQCSLNQNL